MLFLIMVCSPCCFSTFDAMQVVHHAVHFPPLSALDICAVVNVAMGSKCMPAVAAAALARPDHQAMLQQLLSLPTAVACAHNDIRVTGERA